MNEDNPPLIVIGMHRSGTTLLSRLLQRVGVFMGADRNRNEEARFTNAVNEWWFRQASATWDCPEPVDELLADNALRPWLVDYAGGIARGPASRRFLGTRRYLGCRGLDRIAGPWGWKDPRTTYTLPLWLDLFPGARVVHIARHGVDVAASLKVRRERVIADNLRRYQRLRRLYHWDPRAPKRRGFGPQPRCRTLAGGFDLWEAYVGRARAHVDALGERAYELQYETLLEQPVAELERLLAFAGIAATPGDLQAATAGLESSRAHAWRQDADARTFAESVRERLRHHGYGDAAS
jgi:hypothetical protein